MQQSHSHHLLQRLQITHHLLLWLCAAAAIPVVDAVWGEACTSTVQQLVPIFEGELFKQPKSVTKEGKKGKTIDAQVRLLALLPFVPN